MRSFLIASLLSAVSASKGLADLQPHDTMVDTLQSLDKVRDIMRSGCKEAEALLKQIGKVIDVSDPSQAQISADYYQTESELHENCDPPVQTYKQLAQVKAMMYAVKNTFDCVEVERLLNRIKRSRNLDLSETQRDTHFKKHVLDKCRLTL